MKCGAIVMGSLASKEDHPGEPKSFASFREAMVERDIAARGVRDELVLGAMRKVPRELFLPKNLREFAYEDLPLPIAGGQTISQPYIVAFMAESLLLKGGEKILEIGAGSGYAAAVLSEIAAQVYTVERLGQLADKAAATLADLGYDNVRVLHGDGSRGWLEHAPYDAIVVAAGGPQVPESLKAQLKIGGRLVIPVGADQRVQELVRVTRVSENEYRSEDIADVRFVPLIGEGVDDREGGDQNGQGDEIRIVCSGNHHRDRPNSDQRPTGDETADSPANAAGNFIGASLRADVGRRSPDDLVCEDAPPALC